MVTSILLALLLWTAISFLVAPIVGRALRRRPRNATATAHVSSPVNGAAPHQGVAPVEPQSAGVVPRQSRGSPRFAGNETVT